MNNKGLRDPIWQFIGVVVASIGIIISIYALFPQVTHSNSSLIEASPSILSSPTSLLPTSSISATYQTPVTNTGVYPFLFPSYTGYFVDTSVSPSQNYALSLYAVIEHPPVWSGQAALGGIINNATEETTANGTIAQNGLITFTIPVSGFHFQNELFSFSGKRLSTGLLSGTWHSSGDTYGTASGSWSLQS